MSESPETTPLSADVIAAVSRIQQLAEFALDDPPERQVIALQGIAVRASQLLAAYGVIRPVAARGDVPAAEPRTSSFTDPAGEVHLRYVVPAAGVSPSTGDDR